jgi:hypothetical protein
MTSADIPPTLAGGGGGDCIFSNIYYPAVPCKFQPDVEIRAMLCEREREKRKKYCGTFSMERKMAGGQIIVCKLLKTFVSRGQKLLVKIFGPLQSRSSVPGLGRETRHIRGSLIFR